MFYAKDKFLLYKLFLMIIFIFLPCQYTQAEDRETQQQNLDISNITNTFSTVPSLNEKPPLVPPSLEADSLDNIEDDSEIEITEDSMELLERATNTDQFKLPYLNDEQYKEALKQLGGTDPFFKPFMSPIDAKYNFVMRQSPDIRLVLPYDSELTADYATNYNATQHLLSVKMKPYNDDKDEIISQSFYLLNVGQAFEDNEYQNVHVKITLTSESMEPFNVKKERYYPEIDLDFYDFTPEIENKENTDFFLRLLKYYHKNRDYLKKSLTITYEFFTEKKTFPFKKWQQERISLEKLYQEKKDLTDEQKQYLEETLPLTYYKEDIKDPIINYLSPIKVQGYWLFTNIDEMIASLVLNQHHTDESPSDNLAFTIPNLYSEYRKDGKKDIITNLKFDNKSLESSPPSLNIYGTGSIEEKNSSLNQFLITYEGSQMSYTFKGKELTKDTDNRNGSSLGINYSSEPRAIINLLPPEWNTTKYRTIKQETWDQMTYSFIQNIPYEPETTREKVKSITWHVPDISTEFFELGKWTIYDDQNNDVTNLFEIAYEEGKTKISVPPEHLKNPNFFNHNYQFKRSIKFKDDKKIPETEIQKPLLSQPYWPVKAEPITLHIQIDDNEATEYVGVQKEVLNINTNSTLEIRYINKDTGKAIHDKSEISGILTHEIIDPLTPREFPYYKYLYAKPETLPTRFMESKIIISYYYELLPISIEVPETLNFGYVHLDNDTTTSSPTTLVPRASKDWNIKVHTPKENTNWNISLHQTEPFSYRSSSLDKNDIHLVFKTKKKKIPLTESYTLPKENMTFKKEDNYWQTNWNQDTGIMLEYSNTNLRPISNRSYTAPLNILLSTGL